MEKFDNGLKFLGQNPRDVFLVIFAIGVLFCVSSWLIGVADVDFVGMIGNSEILEPKDLASREVGFLWAPSWGLATLIFLPLIVAFFLHARMAFDDGLATMIKTGVIRSIPGREPPEGAQGPDLMTLWKRYSRTYFLVMLVFWLALLLVLIMFYDFRTVVLKWLTDQNFAETTAVATTLSDRQYEFDWSIAATFQGSEVSWIANLIFAALAYLWVPVIGAAVIVATLFWSLSIPNFFSRQKLEKLGYKIQLLPESDDPRKGLEALEEFFNSLLAGSLLTALLALMMHLQNVYLRAESYTSLPSMVFGSIFGVLKDGVSLGTAGKIWDAILTVPQVMNAGLLGNLQVSLTSFGLFLLVVLVSLGIGAWIFATARESRRALLRQSDDKAAIRAQFRDFSPWPATLFTLRYYLLAVGSFALCMFCINLLAVVIFVAVAHFVKTSLSSIFFKEA